MRGGPYRRRAGLLAPALAVVAAVVTAVGAPAPAGAQLSARMSGSVSGPVEGAVLTTPTASVTGSFEYPQDALGDSGTVTSVTISLIADRDQRLPEGSSTVITASPPARTLPFSWTTPRLPWNGPYTVRVVASGRTRLGEAQTSLPIDRHIALALPPARPSGVTAAKAGDGIKVAWDRNPEPDVVLYEVRRAGADGNFTTVAQTTAGLTTLTDSPPFGAWRYVVLAIRLGADDTKGISSSPSQEASVSLSPPPTAGGSGTGGTGGGAAAGGAAGAGGTPTTTGAGGSAPAGTAGSGRSGTVDLSGFGALLNNRRPSATTSGQRINPGDDTFAETLPFDPADQPADPLGSETGEAIEEAQALETELGSSTGDRRRSLSFVAGGLLMFVMAMAMLFVKGEVRRADDLEPLDPRPFPTPDARATLADLADPGVLGSEPPIRSGPMRPRPVSLPAGLRGGPPTPLDAPGLDVPQPVGPGPRDS